MYMLDTNILVYAMRHPQSDLCSRLVDHGTMDLCISSIVYAELKTGVIRSSDPEKNDMALSSVLSGIAVIDFDARAASEYAIIKNDLYSAGTPIEDMDMLIGTHARALGYTLVTDNIKHFGRIKGLF